MSSTEQSKDHTVAELSLVAAEAAPDAVLLVIWGAVKAVAVGVAAVLG